MPLRHASTVEYVREEQSEGEWMAGLVVEMGGLIRRFRGATNRRMVGLQDEARREDGAAGGTTTATTTSARNQEQKRTGSSATGTGETVGDGTGTGAEGEGDTTDNDAEGDGAGVGRGETPRTTFSDDDILECHPFEADMSEASDHPVVRTVVAFLSSMGIDLDLPPEGGFGASGGRSAAARWRSARLPPPHSCGAPPAGRDDDGDGLGGRGLLPLFFPLPLFPSLPRCAPLPPFLAVASGGKSRSIPTDERKATTVLTTG